MLLYKKVPAVYDMNCWAELSVTLLFCLETSQSVFVFLIGVVVIQMIHVSAYLVGIVDTHSSGSVKTFFEHIIRLLLDPRKHACYETHLHKSLEV